MKNLNLKIPKNTTEIVVGRLRRPNNPTNIKKIKGGVTYLSNNNLKFPIIFISLIARINELTKIYQVNYKYYIYNISNITNLKYVREELLGIGGVYLLWNSKTGMFYIGSTIRFITSKNKHGRLTRYFSYKEQQSNRLLSESAKKQISRALEKELVKDSIYSFRLILLFKDTENIITKDIIQEIEQFWMLLKPTLNLSLNAKTGVSNQITTESMRKQSKTIVTFFIYQIDKNIIIFHKTKIFGMRYLSENGFIEYFSNSDASIIKKIEYHIIRYLLDSELIYQNKFLLSFKDLSVNSIVNNKHRY